MESSMHNCARESQEQSCDTRTNVLLYLRNLFFTMTNKHDPSKALRENLVALLESHQLGVSKLAEKSKVSKRMINYILNDERGASIEIADKLAAAFGLTLSRLIVPLAESAEDRPMDQIQISNEQQELWALWENLLPAQRTAILGNIIKDAEHNAALIEQLQARPSQSVMKERVVIVSERRQSHQSFEHTERRKKDGG